MTTGIKNQNEIGAKFLLTDFSQIRKFYSVIIRNSNIQYGTKKEIKVMLQKIAQCLHQRDF